MPVPSRRVVSETVRDDRGEPALLVVGWSVSAGDQLVLTFESATSPWRQGVRFETSGSFGLGGRSLGSPVTIWSDEADEPVRLDIETTDGSLGFYNVWDARDGLGPRWHHRASGLSMTPLLHGTTRYGGNDVGDPPDFERLVFTIRRRTTSLVPDRGGWIPIHHDAAEGDIVGLQDDLAAGMDPSAPDAARWTPLHLAAQERHPAIVRVLIDAGASLDAQNRAGATPLHVAWTNARDGDVEVLRLLIDAGADPDVPNVAGITPRDLADDTADLSRQGIFDR